MKYAIFDTQGIPKAFYDSEIHQNIPAEAAEITDSEWQEFIENQGKRAYINGQIINITNKVFDDNAGTWRDKTEEELLNEIKPRKRRELLSFEKQRVNQVLNQYDYLSLADVQLYANQNDTEAQTLLSWYQTYDDLIWSYIDNDLSAFTNIDELLAIDMKNIEKQIFNQAVKAAPLP